MSIFKKKITDMDNGAARDWDPSVGMHPGICAGACYKEDVEVTFNGETKVQNQIQLYFALQDGDTVKTITSRPYNFSFNERSALSKDTADWGLDLTSIEDLIGAKASLVIAKANGFTNINSILPPQGDVEIDLSDVFIPKFWIEDKNGESTGAEIQMFDDIGVRPEKED